MALSKEHRMQMLLPEHEPKLTTLWFNQCQRLKSKSLADVVGHWWKRAVDAHDVPFMVLMYQEACQCTLHDNRDRDVRRPLIELIKNTSAPPTFWLDVMQECWLSIQYYDKWPSFITAALRHAHQDPNALEKWLELPRHQDAAREWLTMALMEEKISVVRLLAKNVSVERRHAIIDQLICQENINWSTLEPSPVFARANQFFPIVAQQLDRFIELMGKLPPSANPNSLPLSPSLIQINEARVCVDRSTFHQLCKIKMPFVSSDVQNLINILESSAIGQLLFVERMMDLCDPPKCQTIANLGHDYVERSKLLDHTMLDIPRLRALALNTQLHDAVSSIAPSSPSSTPRKM